MANQVKVLESGASIEIQMASWEVCNRLLKAVMREIESVKISVGIRPGMKSLAELDVNEDVLNTIKDIAARLISSDNVETILWECFKTVTYRGKRITTKDIFEPEDARCDYLPIAKEVLVYNLAPFFKNLGSMWSGISKNTPDLKQK